MTLSTSLREATRFPNATVPPQNGGSLIDISSMAEETPPIAAEVFCRGDAEWLRLDDARVALASYYLDAPGTVAGIGGKNMGTTSARIDNAPPAFISFPVDMPDMTKRFVDAFNWRARSVWINSLDNMRLVANLRKTALAEAMEDLADLDEYAAEKGLPPLSPVAKNAARTFLRKVIPQAPRGYAVSPWDDGAVVVHTRGAKGFGVGVYFNAEGGASCYVTRPEDGENEEHHYARAESVPDEFILAALRGLGE